MAQLVASVSGVVLGGVAVGSASVWCSARRCCRGRGFESH